MRKPLLFSSSMIIFGLLVLPAAQAELYRFIDENGNTTYSDQIPQTQSQQGHQILSEDAITLKQIPRRKTEQELEAERLAQQQQDAERRVSEIRRQKDLALLRTFANVEQIDRLRDDRLALIDANIQVASSKLTKVRGLLEAAKIKRDQYLADNQAIPQQLEDNIQGYYNQLVVYENQIKVNERRRSDVEQKFASDRERYQNLSSQRSAAAN